MLQAACQDVEAAPSTPRLAPPGHTYALVALMLAVAATGAFGGQTLQSTTAGAAPAALSAYAPLIVVNLGLAFYVCRVGLQRSILGALFSQGRYDARRALGDFVAAGALALLLVFAENGFATLLGAPESAAGHALLPVTGLEKLLWTFVAMLVGFSEELVYRGYLQRQLCMLSGQLPLAVIGQALLFGIAHGEQGGWAVARFALYSVALGWVAATRRSLIPTVMCHVAVDWYAALNG